MSGDVDVAYSGGRRNGTSAPYQCAISAVRSVVGRADHAVEHARLLRRGDRVGEQRVPAEAADVLPGTRSEPARAGTSATTLGTSASTSSKTGVGTPSRRARADDCSGDGVQLRGAARGDVSCRGRGQLGREGLDDAPLRRRRSSTAPSAAATAQASATAARRRGSARSSPTVRPVAAVSSASGPCRASFSHSTSASLPPSRTSTPARRERLGDGCRRRIVTSAAARCTIRVGPSRHASKRADRGGAHRGEAAAEHGHVLEPVEERHDECRRRGHALERLGQGGRLHRDEQQARRARRAPPPPRAAPGAPAVLLERQPVARDQRRRLGPRDADDPLAGAREPDGQLPPTAPGPSTATVTSARDPSRG